MGLDLPQGKKNLKDHITVELTYYDNNVNIKYKKNDNVTAWAITSC